MLGLSLSSSLVLSGTLYSQGFVHPDLTSRHIQSEDLDAPLPSLTLSSLTISQPEVAHVFHLPLSALTAPARLKSHLFKGDRPYWAITVSDLVDSVVELDSDTGTVRTGGGVRRNLEVWGLTGWYLSLLMKVLEVD
jgi:hypothetical protein